MNQVHVLKRIALDVEKRLNERRLNRTIGDLTEKALRSRMPQPLADKLRREGPQVIAEVKLASPSEGPMAAVGLDPIEVAQGYFREGAAAISVLTEQDHFGGSLSCLSEIRQRCPAACLLMKDFVIDEEQLLEARISGADAVLLIVALLGEEAISNLHERARSLGLSALVEVHNEEEMKIASRLGCEIIGVNTRDLKTLRVSLEVAKHLAPLAPREAILVAESGLTRAQDVLRLHSQGYSAFLIGTHFMKSQNPAEELARFRRRLV